MKRFRIIAVMEVDDAVTPEDLTEYTADALKSWGGQFEPPNEWNDWTGDPLFAANNSVVSVEVKRSRKPSK
jgi:hypothetical protein